MPAISVRVNAKFGYVRAWNFQSPTSQITALGLRKAKSGKGATINGVLYAVKGDNMAAFDEREEGYTRAEISRDMIEATSLGAREKVQELRQALEEISGVG